MSPERTTQPPREARPRRPWARPHLRSEAPARTPPVLLCTTARPVECDGCCDFAPDCTGYCGGG